MKFDENPLIRSTNLIHSIKGTNSEGIPPKKIEEYLVEQLGSVDNRIRQYSAREMKSIL